MDAPVKKTEADRAVGRALPHDSAHLHVSGQAAYTDDLPEPRDLLHVAIGMSTRPHARLLKLDLDAVRAADGVVDTLVAGDIPGDNNFGPIVADDPILVDGIVEYVGHPVFAVAASTVNAARKACALAAIDYEDLEPILDVADAVERESFVLPTETLERGEPRKRLDAAAHRLSGRTSCGGQDQFYLEGHIAMAQPQEDGALVVYSSTQHPDEIQGLVAHATGRSAKDVVVICRRMGGAFG
ncbi:MAG: molybdopterin-dependent oxidoreductase, partial [Woeseiaceae bacterium]|nr:molybdopterin-dependent oxidoreductase [Woeseiaceae bacterium]